MKKTQSAGGVVLNKKGLVLVVNQHGNSWSLPKGHIDPDEKALAAAQREIAEESGIERLIFVQALGGYGRHRIGLNGGEDISEWKTIEMFLFRTDEEKLKPLDPHNPEARWVRAEEVAALLTHPKDKEFFLKIMDELRLK